MAIFWNYVSKDVLTLPETFCSSFSVNFSASFKTHPKYHFFWASSSFMSLGAACSMTSQHFTFLCSFYTVFTETKITMCMALMQWKVENGHDLETAALIKFHWKYIHTSINAGHNPTVVFVSLWTPWESALCFIFWFLEQEQSHNRCSIKAK